MGEERWKTSDTWPPESKTIPYYLRANHQLNTLPPDLETAFDQYQVDPSIGTGHQSRWDTLIGQPLPTPYADRTRENSKVLSYISTPLEQALEVTGHPIVTLYLHASTSDATVFAYLEDVDEVGDVTYVTEGLLRALHRKIVNSPKHFPKGIPYRTFTQDNAAPLVPGQVAKLTFDLLPTSYQFKKGHRVQLTITGSDKDHFASLPGKNSKFSIHHSQAYPSHLDLPIVESTQIENP